MPLQHLPDAQGIKYRLQLNISRLILEKDYGYVVSSMLVVCPHSDLDAPFIDDVPHMAAEVRAIMELCQRAVRERKGGHLSVDTAVQDVFGEDGILGSTSVRLITYVQCDFKGIRIQFVRTATFN